MFKGGVRELGHMCLSSRTHKKTNSHCHIKVNRHFAIGVLSHSLYTQFKLSNKRRGLMSLEKELNETKKRLNNNLKGLYLIVFHLNHFLNSVKFPNQQLPVSIINTLKTLNHLLNDLDVEQISNVDQILDGYNLSKKIFEIENKNNISIKFGNEFDYSEFLEFENYLINNITNYQTDEDDHE